MINLESNGSKNFQNWPRFGHLEGFLEVERGEQTVSNMVSTTFEKPDCMTFKDISRLFAGLRPNKL